MHLGARNHASKERRVVVTGLGAVTPLGNGITETWKNAVNGQSGGCLITHFDVSDCPVKIGCEVKNFDPQHAVGPFHPKPDVTISQCLHPKEVKKLGRYTHFALSAGFEAYADSGIDAIRSKIPSERIATNIGVGMGGLPEIENVHLEFLEKGYKRVTPFFITQVIANMASGILSTMLNFRGPNICSVTACASSAHAVGESLRQIQRGDVDIVLAGGAEAVISKLGIAGFASMRALSTNNDNPKTASRPFDRDRDGFVMAEGGAALILEEYEHAIKRGARIYAEVVGYGASSDAYHMTLPAREGEGGGRAMALALQDARISPEQVGYINAHGTSTPSGDAEEAKAIARVFPNAPSHLNVSSTKSMTGHLLGAAGALESLFSILAIRDSLIPPTINLENLDPECLALGLNFTPNKAVEKKISFALSNSFGFGGTNASLLFGKI